MVSAIARGCSWMLLLHEVAVRAQLQRGQRHVGHVHVALDRFVLAVEHLDAFARHFGGVALFQEDHAARGLQDRGDIRGDEVLALAQADQQRAAHAGADHAVRFLTADHGQRIRTGEFLHRVLQCRQQVVTALQVVVHQVGNDFRVGLRLEHVAKRTELFALLFVVLDDAVVHQRHAVADVRMGVGFGDAAMGGPARMADAQAGVEALGGGGAFHFGHAAGAAHAAHVLLVDHRDTRGIVAPVFQPLQSFDQYRHHVAIGDRAHNSAHKRLSSI